MASLSFRQHSHTTRRVVFASVAALAFAACGGSNKGPGNGPDGGSDMLPNDGPCTPGSMRCNVNDAQVCNADGTMWMTTETCTTFCQEGVCALDGLDIPADMNLDGVVVVAGAVTVHSAATLSSPTGNLTIFCDSITVENGGAIAAAPTGMTPDGRGSDAGCSSCSNTGGSYGDGGRPWGSATDADVEPGSQGSRVLSSTTVAAANGGGVVRIIAKGSATIAGQITANGANGGADSTLCSRGGSGGSGGGILIVADNLTMTGSLSAAGGLGGVDNNGCGTGASGGNGRVKLLFGSASNTMTGTVIGVRTEGLAPPLPVKSLSHPDSTKVYNDGFLSFDLTWSHAFPSAMGTFVRLDQVQFRPPTASDGMFVSADTVSFSPNDIFNGANYVHFVSIDAQSAVGTVETVFKVQINTLGPSVSSSSHPDDTVFSNNVNPFFEWSFPQGDDNVSNTFYVLDNFGDTVPTTSDTALPSTQKQLLKSNVPPGVWVLHVVSADGQGRLTKAAGHYRVNIGADPGQGAIQGNVVDSNNQPVAGATVTINRGLFSTTTASNGTYTLPTVTAGTWELSAHAAAQSASKQITVTKNMSVSGNLTLQ
jgi:hypothetical protein